MICSESSQHTKKRPSWPEPTGKSIEARNATILAYYPLVRTIAYRIAKRIPSNQDVEEFINIGVLGLIDAVERFDPSRGVPFKSYAEIRIQGSIVDALRAADWTPRSVRRKANRIEAARVQLRRKLDREPTRDELAMALEIAPDAYDTLRDESLIRKVVSTNLPVGPDSTTTIEEQVPTDDPGLEDLWVEYEVKQEVVDAIRLLPRKERMAVNLYYLKGLTLKEIGSTLGVTESRACQLRSQGVKRLKVKLKIDL